MRQWIRWSVSMLLVLGVGALAHAELLSGSIVPNGDMEAGAGADPDNWARGGNLASTQLTWAAGEGLDGSYAIKIEDNDAAKYGAWFQNVAIDASMWNQDLTYRFYVKHTGITGGNTVMRVTFTWWNDNADPSPAVVRNDNYLFQPPDIAAYQMQEITGLTVPQDATRVNVGLWSGGQAAVTGTIWLDDLSAAVGMTLPFQIDSYDDFSTTGWADARGTTLLVQADPNEAYEGTSCMQIEYELRGPDEWDIVPYKVFGTPWDLQADPDLALTFWVNTQNTGDERLNQLIIYDTDNDAARYSVGQQPAGWQKITCRIGDFVEDSAEAVDFSQIHRIDWWVSTWPTPGGSVFIDDLQLELAAPTCNTGQIDSLDDLVATGWDDAAPDSLVFQATGEPNTVEGTGSMLCQVSALPAGHYKIQPRQVFDTPQDWTCDEVPTALTFWVYAENLGDERVNQILVWDSAGHLSRFDVGQFGTPGWQKVTAPISQFYANDPANPTNFGDVKQLHFWINTHPTIGGDILIDDIQLEEYVAMQPPFQLDSFDDIAAYNWVETRGTDFMVQAPPGEVYEGAGSMGIEYSRFDGTWDIVPRRQFAPALDLSDYENLYLTFWLYRDLVGDARLNQLILYDSVGHIGRFTPPTPLTPGWQQVVTPLRSILWDGEPEPNQIAWDNINRMDLWFSTWDDAGNDVYIDDLWITDTPPEVFTEAYIADADFGTITVDGSAADWAGLDSEIIDFNLADVPGTDNGNLHVQYRMAWDADYLYVLIEELAGDDIATEAANLNAMNDGAGGDVLYDSLALYMDWTNDGQVGTAQGIDTWYMFGLSSTARTDLLMCWANGQWDPHVPSAVANAQVATTGTLGSRVVEARISWQDIEDTVSTQRKPAGGLLPAIVPGFVFGCDPRLADLELSWDPGTSTRGAAWFTGALWSSDPEGMPSGSDVFSTDMRLICSSADLNFDCSVDLVDFGIFSTQWYATGCSNANDWCNNADIKPFRNGMVNLSDLARFAGLWLEQ